MTKAEIDSLQIGSVFLNNYMNWEYTVIGIKQNPDHRSIHIRTFVYQPEDECSADAGVYINNFFPATLESQIFEVVVL